MPIQRIRCNDAHGRQQAERDGQVIVTALLGQVGRREVDGDMLGRQREANGGKGRPHALAAFADGLVRQADNGEMRIA